MHMDGNKYLEQANFHHFLLKKKIYFFREEVENSSPESVSREKKQLDVHCVTEERENSPASPLKKPNQGWKIRAWVP